MICPGPLQHSVNFPAADISPEVLCKLCSSLSEPLPFISCPPLTSFQTYLPRTHSLRLCYRPKRVLITGQEESTRPLVGKSRIPRACSRERCLRLTGSRVYRCPSVDEDVMSPERHLCGTWVPQLAALCSCDDTDHWELQLTATISSKSLRINNSLSLAWGDVESPRPSYGFCWVVCHLANSASL